MTEYFCIGAKKLSWFPGTGMNNFVSQNNKGKKRGVLGISIVTWELFCFRGTGRCVKLGFMGSGARSQERSACGVGGGETRRAKKKKKKLWKKQNKKKKLGINPGNRFRLKVTESKLFLFAVQQLSSNGWDDTASILFIDYQQETLSVLTMCAA